MGPVVLIKFDMILSPYLTNYEEYIGQSLIRVRWYPLRYWCKNWILDLVKECNIYAFHITLITR